MIDGTTSEANEMKGYLRELAWTDEWTIAALTHASVLLTLILGLAGGIGAVLGLAVPLMVYFAYRERSRFIALHALQSFVFQAIGIVAYLVLVAVLAVWGALAWAASWLLSTVLIGILLMPFAAFLTVQTGLLMLGAPIAWIVYGLYAAYHVYQGRRFHYLLIGEWLEREVLA